MRITGIQIPSWARWIGGRYLRSKKSSRFLSLITILSIGGVAVGVTAMIVVLSVMDGFEGELRKRLSQTELHILVTPTELVTGFEQGRVPGAALPPLDEPRIIGRADVLATEVILRSSRRVGGVVAKGIEGAALERIRAQLSETVDPQRVRQAEESEGSALPGVFVGNELALSMSLLPGDLVTMVSPTETEGPLATVPRMKKFIVQGVFRTGFADQELHTVFLERNLVEAFLRKRGVVSQWEFLVKDFDAAPDVAKKLRSRLAPLGFEVKDWMELNSAVFASMKLERIAMFVILAFIVIVASFNIVTTLTLLVLEKKREIAILKTMGARNEQVAGIFLYEGVLIGVCGVGLGAVLSIALTWVMKNYPVVALPEIYYDRTFPVAIVPGYYALVVGSALVIVALACVYPSRRAAALRPLDGIRA